MLRKIWVASGTGLLWLFVFSIPIGHNKRLYDLAWFYIVDTPPVHWAVGAISGSFNATSNSAKETAEEIVGKMDEKLSQAKLKVGRE